MTVLRTSRPSPHPVRLGCAALLCVLLGCGGGGTSDQQCGAGTRPEGNSCVPDLAALCGSGTHFDGARCALEVGPDAFCGPGTVASSGACVSDGDPSPWCGPGTVRDGAACVPSGDPAAFCGPGTRPEGSRCVFDGDPTAFCGAGTEPIDGLCAPSTPAGAFCGAGTTLVGSVCVPSLDPATRCGAGTTFAGGVCVPSAAPADFCGPGTALVNGVCVASTDPARWCGAGTVLLGGACVPATSPALRCGPGTAFSGSVCLPTANPAGWCGPGTVLEVAQCVPARSADAWCGAGTVLAGAVCVPARSPADFCAAGTHLDGEVCVVDEDATPWCGPGTVAQGGLCRPETQGDWQVRLGAAQVWADGYSRVPVLVTGPVGAPVEYVTLALSRDTAGALLQPILEVGPAGALTYLVACSSSSPSCVGPARVLAFRAGEPLPAAQSEEVLLAARPPFGDPGPCLAAPNAIHLDGDGYIFTGTATYTEGTFSAVRSQIPYVVDATYRGAPAGEVRLEFSTEMMLRAIEEQVYADALGRGLRQFNHPSIDIGASSSACGYPRGAFQVVRLEVVDHVISEFLVTFEQVCDYDSTPLRGCFHYTAPAALGP